MSPTQDHSDSVDVLKEYASLIKDDHDEDIPDKSVNQDSSAASGLHELERTAKIEPNEDPAQTKLLLSNNGTVSSDKNAKEGRPAAAINHEVVDRQSS